MLTQPNITEADLNKIITPTFILAGSKDIVRDEHTKIIANDIQNSVLKVLEGENYSSYVLHSEKLYEIIKSFLI